jgi:opacity protein-like surface antigen
MMDLAKVNMKKGLTISAVLAVMSLGVAAPAMADVYVGANVGYASAGGETGNPSDKSGGTYGVVVGTDVGSGFGVEAGYERLNDLKWSDGSKAKADALSVAGTYSFGTMHGIAPYAKVGITQSQFKVDGETLKGNSPFVAVGADIQSSVLPKGTAFNVEVKHHENFANEDVRFLGVSAGVKYSF